MFGGGRGKGKASGIVPVTAPAQVFAELPELPRPTQPRVRDEWERDGMGRDAAAAGLPGAAGQDAASRGQTKARYAMVFSDGQRVPVGARCGAGRMPPLPSERYDGFAVVHDATQQISRRHFEFGVTTLGQVWVMDCDSANGTWLESDGTRIQLPRTTRVGMSPGDMVRFGAMRARLESM